MTRTCRFGFASRSGQAEWSFDGSYLVVTPDQGSPIPVPVTEVAGIAGDGYELRLALPGAPGPGSDAPDAEDGFRDLVLTHLGAEGATLVEDLRRAWLPARAGVLRLSGSGRGKPFAGFVASFAGVGTAGSPEPFHGLLFEDVLVFAREGRDLEPLFLALVDAVEFEEAAYSVRVRQSSGREVLFSKMAGRTEEFLRALRANRSLLAAEAGAALAAAAPTLPAGSRSVLAGMWPPGRLLEIEAMDTICPGFAGVLRETLLPESLRLQEAQYLLNWAAAGSSWLGCTRETAELGGETARKGGSFWLLCGKEGTWFLEALSSEDRATYCFAGGEDTPELAAGLLCAPQFSREALYSPLEELRGDKAELAIAAQSLGFLVELRGRFRGRVIHQTLEGWREDIDRLSRGARN